MEPLAPSTPAPSKQQLIAALSTPIARVIQGEMSDESDVDRVWLLRKFHKNYLYYRDLAYFAPAIYQGLIDATGIDGGGVFDPSWQAGGVYDYTQNIYRGYCRKLEAVLGTRIPNAVAVPNDPSDEKDIAAARAANNAALYVREHCDLQVQILWLVFSLFNFGTSFWNIEWVIDGEKNGYKTVDQPLTTESVNLGQDDQQPEDGAFMQPPTSVDVPKEQPPVQVPKGALEIEICDGSEISVPLDVDGLKGVSACYWLRRERERHKSYFLSKYNGENDTVNLRELLKSGKNENGLSDQQSASQQYGESVRSAMASPIGVVRPRRENRWTEQTEDWTPQMYVMVDDANARKLLKENYPRGIRITSVKGHVVDLEDREVHAHWQECQPEPTKRIMCEPLGDDWVVTQDILNNILNQLYETIERSNEPGFADPTRVDLDAWQRRRDNPGDLIPALRPPGGRLEDLIHRPAPVQFSEQILPFRQQTEATTQQNTGLLEIIWGGDTSDPTARQSELKTNAAIRQLSVIWVMIGKSLERLYEKACALLAENEEGVLAFSKQKANEYGKFDTVSVVIEDLKGGEYHFEADEAIPMTWGQQRDLLMWMLDKPAEILKAWGLDDPLNIYEFKTLLGMPGMRVPHLDDRDKGMDIIAKLLDEQAQPDPQNPQQKVPSIAPDWEDDSEFMAKLAKAYLTVNFEMKDSNAAGYENVQLWGQAHEKRAQQPPQKPPVKGAVSVSLKGADLGDPAVQAALQGTNIIPEGVQVQAVPPPPKLNGAPPLSTSVPSAPASS